MKISQVFLNIFLAFIFALLGVSSFIFAYSHSGEKQAVAALAPLPLAIIEEADVSVLDWQEAGNALWQPRDSHVVAVFQDKLWMAGGLNGNDSFISPGVVEYEKSSHFSDVWQSYDGLNWQIVLENTPWGKLRSAQAIEFKGRFWLMGGWGPDTGYLSSVWSSADGVIWIKETDSAAWPAREGQQIVVFKDKLWLIGGVRYDTKTLFNDVWFSEDGANWTEATPAASWTARWDHASAVFQDKIWLSAGMAFGNKIFNDVWYSENGIDWFLATDPAPWMARQGHVMVNYKDNLWILGRLDVKSEGGNNDIWYSENGFDWKKTLADPQWTGREDFSAVVFKDKIWIFGGMDKNWQWKNDIWFSNF